MSDIITIRCEGFEVRTARISPLDWEDLNRILIHYRIIPALKGGQKSLEVTTVMLSAMPDEMYKKVRDIAFKCAHVNERKMTIDVFSDDMSQLYVYLHGWLLENFGQLVKLFNFKKAGSAV